jgi:RNA polymerase sigma-70 factor, ECF subfamily
MYMHLDLPDFSTLQRLYFKRLFVYASMIGIRSTADREEIAHDALVHVYLSLGKYDQSKPLTPWVYAIARNVMIDSLRSRSRANLPITSAEDKASGEDVADTFAMRDTITRVRYQISRMRPRDQEIALLVFFESLSAAETGRILGIPSATVRWRIAEIRKHLRKTCGEDI